MFLFRGIAVSLSAFVTVYAALSLAVGVAWRKIATNLEKPRARRTADLLFALRMLPFAAAAAVTLALAVPSFLLLEPRAIVEPVGAIPLVLGSCGILLVLFGVINAGIALRRASRGIALWTLGAESAECAVEVPVLRIARAVPAMTVAGIARPRVLLSRAAEFLLNEGELRRALNHEVAHVRRRDNLKKLMLRLAPCPGLRGLEAAWLEATEMAADDAAVSDAAEALDLAAALIKLSRLSVEPGPIEPCVDLTAALVHGPASAVNVRVERLIAWRAEQPTPPRAWSPLYGLTAALITLGFFAVTYSQLLVQVHEATEWLVR
jgi:beta-lactamase regulating signal transducer with metallopeptidase domain